MTRSSMIVLSVLLLSTCQALHAVKSLKLSIPKNQPIIVEIPPDQWANKEASWGAGIPIYVIRADRSFLSERRWENGALPSFTEFHLEKAHDCGSGVMSGRIVGCPPNWREVELRSPSAWLKIQFSSDFEDVEAALKGIVFLGSVSQFEDSGYIRDKIFLPNQERLFASLPQLDIDKRFDLFKAGLVRGLDVSSTSFKGTTYLLLGIHNTVSFNTLRTSQDERVAQVLRETVLPAAKEFLSNADVGVVGGLAFHISIPAYNFVTGNEMKFDDLLVYFKLDELKSFAASDITSQKLVDSSVVLLNEDRTEVRL